MTLPEHLCATGLDGFFATAVTSARAGAPKPDPRLFRLALGELGVEPGRALHIGDSDADREGAQAAGIAFAPTPVVTLPARLGLDG
jgi:HAD superfamily hydrolase (TIGR01509 family)